ncbi:Glycoside hydrolase [Parasponia andersonii]|uniref:mannosyl-glycoprotein endo-beta-N-acetylglucosaminidase n=1 Tax=Parasponia andersonii TaxID=3476 RepID=A0A2P5BRP0_PARAD|nr:Glycoside hydrolase [Parasponia andersonii]
MLPLRLRQAYLDHRFSSPLHKFLTLIRQKVHKLFLFFFSRMSKPITSSKPELDSSAPDLPEFDPTEPSAPESYPIKTLEELDSRSYFDSFHYPFNKSSVPLQAGTTSSPDRPRLLVCHDMAGGYGDDKWVQGGTNGDAYAIWHWHLIDVFVYFSHNLVALPPVSWTNTAHQHGVKVLGTFIVEWDAGRAIADKLLATEESSKMYAERLTELAVALGFDGWLLNMEVSLNVSQIPILKIFVSHLTQAMHSAVPGSLTNFALDVLKKGDVSAAVFAPGWVYETKQPPDFQTAQNHIVFPSFLHFSPLLEYRDSSTTAAIKVLVNLNDASYRGGSNITFKGNLQGNANFTTRLFLGELPLGDSPLQFTYSVKTEANSLLGLYLDFSSREGERKFVLLAPGGVDHLSSKFSEVVTTRQVENLDTSSGWVIQESSISMSGHTLTEISALCYRPDPRFLKSDDHGALVHSSAEYYAVLGHLTVNTSKQKPNFPPSSSWVVEGQHIKWSPGSDSSKTVSVKIIWNLKDGNDSAFPKFNIYAENEFLGVARVQAFYVADFAVPSGSSGVKFYIQVCGVDGSSQKLDASPFLQLEAPKVQ